MKLNGSLVLLISFLVLDSGQANCSEPVAPQVASQPTIDAATEPGQTPSQPPHRGHAAGSSAASDFAAGTTASASDFAAGTTASASDCTGRTPADGPARAAGTAASSSGADSSDTRERIGGSWADRWPAPQRCLRVAQCALDGPDGLGRLRRWRDPADDRRPGTRSVDPQTASRRLPHRRPRARGGPRRSSLRSVA